MSQDDISLFAFGPVEVTRCIWLPQRDEMRSILDKYFSDVNDVHHIIHVPTLRNTVEQIYDAMDRNTPINIGVMVLVLSICCASTCAWSLKDDARLLYVSAQEAHSQARSWLKACLDAMDHAQRAAQISLECVQGITILFFVLCNMEGLSRTAKALHTRAITMARDLSLHRIDARGNMQANIMKTPAIEASRRVWWLLVAIDW